MTGLLELVIKGTLYLLPDCITVGLDNHATANRSLLCKVSLNYQFIIPLRVVLASFGKIFKFFCHILRFFGMQRYSFF